MKNALGLFKLILPGLFVAVLLTVATTLLTRSLSLFSNFFIDPIFLGLVLGLGARWILGDRFKFWPGFGFTQDLFIPLGVLLYATQVRWNVFSATTIKEFFVPIALSFIIYYLFLVWPSERLKVRRRASLLVWASCALVGPIAVVLLAPALDTSDEETSLSLILSTFAATLMLILIPIISHFYTFSLFTVGALSTLALPLVSPVNPITSGSFEAIEAATLFFATKIALLGPIALIFYFGRKGARAVEKIPLASIAAFIAIGLFFTFLPSVASQAYRIFPYSQFALTMAMVGVGLSTNLKRLLVARTKTVALYLILAGGASLVAFVVETLTVRYFVGG